MTAEATAMSPAAASMTAGATAMAPEVAGAHHVIDIFLDRRRDRGGGDSCSQEEEEGRICRVCQLATADDHPPQQRDPMILLGCECKQDLSAAHRKCALIWFRTKGNRRCEICGSIARNVEGVPDEGVDKAAATAAAAALEILGPLGVGGMPLGAGPAGGPAQNHHPCAGWISGLVCLAVTIFWVFRSKHDAP